MVDTRDMIRGKLFTDERKVFAEEQKYDQFVDNLAEGVVWDFLNTNLSDILHGGAAAGLKKSIKKQLDKTLGKDNKKIVKAIDMLKQAYGNRLSTLTDLKNKVAGKISRNKSLSDNEKNELTQGIQSRIDDSAEMLKALDGEAEEISAELEPKSNVEPNTPVAGSAAAAQEEPEAEPEVEEPEAEAEPEVAPEPKGDDTKTVLNKVNQLDKGKQDQFKQRVKTIIARNGPRLVSTAMERVGAVSETEELEEKIAINQGVNNLARAATNNISNSLRKKPKTKKAYDGLDRNVKNRVNRFVVTNAVKAAMKSLGPDFLKSEEPAPQEEPAADEPEVQDEPEDAGISFPDDADLEPVEEPTVPEEPVADEPADTGVSFPDDAELEQPEEEPESMFDPNAELEPVDEPEIEEPAPEPVSEPEPEAAPVAKATDVLGDASVEDAGSFLREKGLLSKNATEAYSKLNDEGKKAVVSFAIQKLEQVTSNNMKEEKLSAAELGLPADTDLSGRNGVIRALSKAISRKAISTYNKQQKAAAPKKSAAKKKTAPKKRVAKSKPQAKAQVQQDKQDAETAPPAPEPEPEKPLSTTPPEPEEEPVAQEPEEIPEPEVVEPEDDIVDEIPDVQEPEGDIDDLGLGDIEEPEAVEDPGVAEPPAVDPGVSDTSDDDDAGIMEPSSQPEDVPERPRANDDDVATIAKAEVPEVGTPEFEQSFTSEVGPDLIDNVDATGDPSLMNKVKQLYRRMKTDRINSDAIKNRLDQEVDKWYERNDMFQESVRKALSEAPSAKAATQAAGTLISSGLSNHIVANDLQTIQKGDIVVYDPEQKASEPEQDQDSPQKKASLKTAFNKAAQDANAVNEVVSTLLSLAGFKEEVEELNQKGQNYGMVKSVNKEGNLPTEVTIQPLVGKRTARDPEKMALKKNGKPITVGIDSVSSIAIPKKSIPKEAWDKIKQMGIVAAAAGAVAATGAAALASQNAGSRLTEVEQTVD